VQYSESTSYDYHPPLPPSSDAEAAETDATLGDCAICMDAIRYDARAADDDHTRKHGGAERRGLLARFAVPAGKRKSYSLSPCHHLFVRRRFIAGVHWSFAKGMTAYGVLGEVACDQGAFVCARADARC
jgi:hypothetical protein